MYSTPIARDVGRRRPLFGACAALFALAGCDAFAATRTVTSCADDGSPSTLRGAIGTAGAHDIIDMSALACSTITLGASEIAIGAGNLTIVGPGLDRLTIDAAGKHRIFDDTAQYRHALHISNLTLANGYATGPNAYGGCVYAAFGDVTLDHVAVTTCAARAVGGSASGYASGGGVSAGYSITANACTATGNSATSTANSAFYAKLATGGAFSALTIAATTCTFSGNSAHAAGAAKSAGGALYGGAVNLTQSTVTGNHAIGGTYSYYAYGGGAAGGTVTLYRSTVDNNISDGGSGGLSTSTLNCYDSTVSGNRAVDGAGGGVSLVALKSAACTIAFNRASAGGGGIYMPRFSSGGGWTINSTLVAQNIADPGASFAADIGIGNNDNPSITGANDLIMAADAAAVLPPGTIHTSPQLLPLADNGGPTRTHALPMGSPAIDAGNNAANLATDQRGELRVYGTRADIGAYESQPDLIFADGFE